jgi:hypothetical protein
VLKNDKFNGVPIDIKLKLKDEFRENLKPEWKIEYRMEVAATILDRCCEGGDGVKLLTSIGEDIRNNQNELLKLAADNGLNHLQSALIGFLYEK